MKVVHHKLNLDRPAIYQIKVSGRLDENLSDWVEGMTITVEREDVAPPVTTLVGVVADQAAPQGLLRRLYSVALPLNDPTARCGDQYALRRLGWWAAVVGNLDRDGLPYRPPEGLRSGASWPPDLNWRKPHV
jgi:hypothetical protein